MVTCSAVSESISLVYCLYIMFTSLVISETTSHL